MHYKQNNKESKSYVQGLRLLGNTLPRNVKGILKKNGYNYSEIINKWSILVGKNISNFSYPQSIKITQGSKKKKLIIAVERGNEINVEYSKKEIIDKINSYFGYNLINEIILKTINAKNKEKKKKNIINRSSDKLEKKINEIQNKNIRNSLSKLLNAAKNV